MKVSIVIPAFNEERHVADVVRACLDRGVPVTVVDDCSTDATADRARAAGADVVRHEMNRGKGASLATGMSRARELGFDAVVTLDGDGQHDPAEVPRFVRCAEETGADIVVGSRFLRRGEGPPGRSPGQLASPASSAGAAMPLARRLTNWYMSRRLSGLAGKRLTDTQSGFRLVRLDAWEKLDLSTSRFDTESEMLVYACRMGLVVREVPIRTIYGDEESSISPVRDTFRWLRLLRRLRRVRRTRKRGRG